MVRAYVFDFDGTLIATVSSIWKEFQRVTSVLGLEDRTYKEFSQQVGRPWIKVLHGLWPDLDIDAFNREYDNSHEVTEPIPGVGEALSILSERFILAILTSRGNDTLDLLKSGARLDDTLFKHVFHRENVPYHKPDPRVFSYISSELGVGISDLTFVGDSIIDAECAINAKVDFIGVLTGAASRDDFKAVGVSNILESVSEIR